jgi:hypothetical protein
MRAFSNYLALAFALILDSSKEFSVGFGLVDGLARLPTCVSGISEMI